MDGFVHAAGLLTSVRQTLGCKVDVFALYGCNRQVSQHGQTHWLSPLKAQGANSLFAPRGHELDRGTHRSLEPVTFQMGAGGGGLTQAPSQPANTDEFLEAFKKIKIDENKF